MKLVETPIQSNLDLETIYPKISTFLFEKSAIKFYKIYALDRNQIIYVDLFDKELVLMVNTKRKIAKNEIDFVLRKLLNATREEVIISVNTPKLLKVQAIKFNKACKDIIMIEKDR
ncbi:hypothetical protein M2139_000697 [Enterococcus sp. PF1-24]|uniref:DUF1827 family protein n=1 Tax=unclassified Enterococcus TaxID=2608891 RepID=UPI0024762BED|nr:MULTISPECIES: DUF1827 family protein [unclassified Enterococcus]MDH6363580.1 hypothetical protein [Enterococcus sp. PFB1-1]MDH6400815.1 hypothetical protein [Enterococcus sp. PF1-24]